MISNWNLVKEELFLILLTLSSENVQLHYDFAQDIILHVPFLGYWSSIFFSACVFIKVSICLFFHSFSEFSQEEKLWYYVNGEPAGILFALNCCGILCLSGYLTVTIFCHRNSLYLDKAMYKTLWLTCLFVLGIWFQNIIWITGFKFHGLQFKMRWRKVLSTHRCIV